MRHIILLISIMVSTASFAFESLDSALDFVYEYASDTMWGIKISKDYAYRVGVMEHDVDKIINYRDVYENNNIMGSETDTFAVPTDCYIFSVTTPEEVIIEGSSPFVSYMFLSKTDSTFSVIDTVGVVERYGQWDTIRTVGRLLKNQAIEDISSKVDHYTSFYTGVPSAKSDIYIIEDTATFGELDCADEMRKYVNLKIGWFFIIDTYNDTCLLVGYGKDTEHGYIMGSLPTALSNKTDLLKVEGFRLVYSKKEDSGVESIDSELRVSVYPNPATDFISVDAEGCSLSLYSINGSLLKKNNGNTLYVSEFSSGTYFLKITMKDSSVIKKIIIQR